MERERERADERMGLWRQLVRVKSTMRARTDCLAVIKSQWSLTLYVAEGKGYGAVW